MLPAFLAENPKLGDKMALTCKDHIFRLLEITQ
jgi:hypothetical protein